MHGGPLDVHHRPGLPAHRALQGRHARRHRRPAGPTTSRSPRRSSRSAMPPASSARTISATATSSCRPPRVRRILRQPLSPQRRGGAGAPILSEERSRRSSRPTRPAACLKASADGKIEDTGPLNRKRMETIDDETTAAAIDFMQRQAKANKPFFVWMNTTRMHVFTHVRESMRGKSGMPGNEYADGMIEHDGDVGKLLKAMDDLGIANNTIVVYTTDNGPNQCSLAGRGDDAVPQREGHQLGRRLPRAGDGPLAGPHQARRGLQRDGLRPRLVPDAAGGRRRHRYQGAAAQGRQASAARPSRCIWTATTSCPT